MNEKLRVSSERKLNKKGNGKSEGFAHAFSRFFSVVLASWVGKREGNPTPPRM